MKFTKVKDTCNVVCLAFRCRVCIVYHGGTYMYPRTLAFEVLNFTHENGWNRQIFHRTSIKELLNSYILGGKTWQNTYGLFPIIMSNDPCKNKFNHASAKSVPTFGRACVLYGELRVKWTCVIFADFGHGDFLISKWAAEIFFFYRGLLIKSVRTSSWISVLSFARAKNILWRLSRR